MSITLPIWTAFAIYMFIGVIFAEASDFAMSKRSKKPMSSIVYIIAATSWALLLLILAIRNRSS